MKKKHVKIPTAFDAAELQRRYEVAVDRYMNGSVSRESGWSFPAAEKFDFPTAEDAYAFLIEAGAAGRSLYTKAPINIFPGFHPVYLLKEQSATDADIEALKAKVEAEYRAELDADRQQQIALLIEQQESLFQRKEAERLEQERLARLEQFRKDAEEVLK